VADKVTWTAALYQLLEHGAPLHAIVVAGDEVSICTCWDCTDSVLPAVSTEKNFTVDVLEAVNGPVYLVLEVVGVEPSVV